jgi:hypothetical protein
MGELLMIINREFIDRSSRRTLMRVEKKYKSKSAAQAYLTIPHPPCC